MRTSLEEERRALLEEIEARRGLYRRLLSGDREDHQTTGIYRPASSQAVSPRYQRLGQWLLDHPLPVATGVALLVWLGPRLMRRHQTRATTATQTSAAGQRSGMLKAIAGMMVMFLRDPRQLQTTARMVGTTWRWLRRATTAQTHTHARKPYA